MASKQYHALGFANQQDDPIKMNWTEIFTDRIKLNNNIRILRTVNFFMSGLFELMCACNCTRSIGVAKWSNVCSFCRLWICRSFFLCALFLFWLCIISFHLCICRMLMRWLIIHQWRTNDRNATSLSICCLSLDRVCMQYGAIQFKC